MLRYRVALFGLLASAIAAVGCSGLSYNSDFDPQVDFSGYSTYAWVEDLDADAVESRGVDPLDEKRVIAAVDQQLSARGYRKVTSGTADFAVHFYVTTQEKVDVNSYYTGWGYYGWYGGTQTYVRQWTQGTLVVDVLDINEKDLAWRGWVTGAVDDFARKTPEQKTQDINRLVAGILKGFPPGAK
jgi:hypothetical protein